MTPEPTEPLVRETLPDGTRVVLRALAPSDARLLLEGFERLSSETRYRRFLQALTKLTPAQLEYLTCVDGHSHLALGAAVEDPNDGTLTGIGVARSVRDSGDPSRAEFAIVIADEFQGRGLGKRLTRALAARALAEGVRQWHATMLADNVAVRRVLEDVGTETSRSMDGRGCVDVLFTLHLPAGAT